MKRVLLLASVAASLLIPCVAEARLTKFVVDKTRSESPTFGGYSFPGVGQYEKIVGTAHAEVNPFDPKNSVIVDIQLAPRNRNGNVDYSFDFYILKPIRLEKGNNKVMYEPPNRGNKTWGTLGRFPAGGNDPGSVTDPAVLADAFFMPRGYTIVFSGWDKAAGTDNSNFTATISLPIAKNGNATITGPSFEYLVTGNGTTRSFALSYPAADPTDKTTAKLTHRVHLDDAPNVLLGSEWDFTDATGTAIRLNPSGHAAACTPPVAGTCFIANDIYEFSYTAKDPTVNSLGFAAIRDFNAWLRYDEKDDAGNKNPLHGHVHQVYTEVVSQPGRTLNDFTHLGFNQAENGKKVFDGMLQWIAAGDGLSMNYRFSQPGRTERNRQDHLFAEAIFPFANVMTTDPFTGKRDSRFAKCEASGTCPVAMEIYSANEYWVKAASLLHTMPDGTRDLPDSPFARNYFISSHQHGSAAFKPVTSNDRPSKGACQQPQNPLNSAPVQRALWIAMDKWVTEGVPPPDSKVPRLSDGTLVAPLPQSTMGFPSIPGVTYTGLKTTRYRYNFGAGFYETGIATINPPVITPPYEDNPANGPIYPSFIPKTDSDGNDIAGIRLADVTVPIATYTGWALRAGRQANDGCEAAGQFISFATTEASRKSGDPRPSVATRYGTLDQYVSKVAQALQTMIQERLLLCEDYDAELNRLTTLGAITGGLTMAPAGQAVPPPPPPAACQQRRNDEHDD